MVSPTEWDWHRSLEQAVDKEREEVSLFLRFVVEDLRNAD